MAGIRTKLLALCALSIGTIFSVNAEYGDVVLNRYAEANDMRPVIFPHWFHRIRFRCKVCHSELGFEMRAGSNDISMVKLMDGDYCGMCHNEEIAWGLDHCDRCHSGKPGLKSGIYGGHETMGPSIW
ncbi:c(7)-type cytochrome triheme domain-containing protein [Thalassotalea aquiviva]|uniref:c(7)-type cytochrome triheme domain-containing protein n=1 Tax=Thalassotalea aquiviva TaxID=3242415 RepID=UPI00352B28CC